MLHRGPRSERALEARRCHLVRLGGAAALAMGAVLHSLVLPDRSSTVDLVVIIGGLAAWSVGSSLAYSRWHDRPAPLDVGGMVLLGDVVAWTLVVYQTGADRSLLFLLVLLPAGAMWTVSCRRLLVFGHFAVGCYLSLLVYVATVNGRIDWPFELVKVGVLYLMTLYLAFTAKATEALEAARDRTRASKTTALANVTHELRTPLNGVIGGTRLLESTALNPAQRHHVAMVRDSADTLLRLIDEILDVSKLEANKLTIEPVAFSVRGTVTESVRPLTPAADAKGLLLRAQIADEVPDALVGDPVRLRQIIVNLVSNAIKFTDDGDIEVRVTLEPADNDEIVLHVTVRDTGIGIPSERREAIFEAFTQADSSTTRTHGGTGLGLTIASRLAELMGGRLWVESKVGCGSTFHVTVRAKLAAPRAEPPAPELAGLTALVAEPNQAHRAALVDMLDVWGIATTHAESSQEVLSQVVRARDGGRPYDVIFLGIDLIDMDGLHLTERLRGTDAYAGPIIMLMRAVVRGGDRERCAELGVNAVITRPFSQSEVLDALALALARPMTAGAPLHPRRALAILLADDNAVNREVAISYLIGWGHAVTPVADGFQALAMLQRRRFDVAFLDLLMPGADGFEVTADVRRRETATGPRLAIIAMTACALPGDRERCLDAGMDGYVTKPVEAVRLFETLESVTAPASNFRAAVLEHAGGDALLQQRMVRLFLEHAPDARARLHDALVRRDAAALAASAHWLKGAVGNFPAPAAMEAAERVEMLGRTGDLDAAAIACATLEAELDQLASALGTLLSRESDAVP